MNKTLLSAVLIPAVLVLAALVAGPSLVDWDKLKLRVVAALEAQSGLDIAVDGPLSFVALPRPTLRAARVRVAGAAVDAIDLRLAWAPLVRGQVGIASLRLEAPDVLLERGADGAPNGLLEALRAAAAAPAVSVARVSVAGGRLRYVDRRAGIEEEISGIDLALAPAARGFGAEGSARWRGRPVYVAVSLDRAAGGAPLRVLLESGGAQAAFRGETPARSFAGRLSVKGEAAAAVPLLLAAAGAGNPAPTFAPGTRFEAESPVRYDDGRIVVPELALRLADVALEGELAVSAPPRRFALSLAADRLNLDALAAVVAPPPAAPEGAAEPWRGPGGDVSFAADALLYRGRIVRRAALEAAFDGGAVAVHRLAGELPGGTMFVFERDPSAAAGTVFDGRVEAASDNLRALLAWFGVEAPGVRADRLRRFSLAAAVEGGGRGGRLNDAALVLDTTAASVSAAWAFGPRPEFELDIGLDRIDLDAYLRRPADAAGGILAALAAFDARVALEAETVTLGGLTMHGIAARGTLRDGALTLDELGVDDLAGGAASATGTLTDLGTAPAVEAAVHFRTADLAGAARALPALSGVPPDVAATLDAELSGGIERIAVDAELAAADAEIVVRGTVADALAAPLFDLAAAVESPNAARLLGAFGVLDASAAPPVLAGPAMLEAGFIGSARAMAFEAAASLADGRVSANGTVDGGADDRRLDLEAEASHPDVSRLLPLLTGAAAQAALAGPAAARATAAGGAAELVLDAAVEHAGGALSVTGAVADPAGSPSFDLAVALDHPAMAALFAGLGVDTALTRRPGAIAVRARVAADAAGVEVRDLDADLGGARVAGGLALDLAAAAGGAARESARSPPPLGLSALRSVGADLRVAADSLDIGGLPFEDADLRLTLDDGTLEVAALTGRLFGGAAEARGTLAAGAVPRLDGAISVDGADAAAALTHLAATGSMTGAVDFEMRFSTAGENERQMILALDGEGALSGAGGGWIGGVDLAVVSDALGAARGTGRQPGLPDAADGRTAWRELGGAFRIAGGRLRANDIRLVLDGAEARVAVDADLAARRHELAAAVRFDAHPDLPPLALVRRGPLDAPVLDIPAAAAARYFEVHPAVPEESPAEPAAGAAPARAAEPRPPAPAATAAPLPPPGGTLPAPPERADAFDAVLSDLLGE